MDPNEQTADYELFHIGKREAFGGLSDLGDVAPVPVSLKSTLRVQFVLPNLQKPRPLAGVW